MTKGAIFRRFLSRLFLTAPVTVLTILSDWGSWCSTTQSWEVIPTPKFSIQSDAHSPLLSEALCLYKWRFRDWIFTKISLQFPNHALYPLRFYKVLQKMGDNLRRAVQDLDLGVDDAPIALPADVVNQAAAENRFVIVGRPTIPRRQNLRSIIAVLPRTWGHAGLVHGRIIEGGRFQFVFPTEEAMANVLRRGPWAFSDRMLVLQRWTPQLNPVMMNFIPFWIQIRGIPLQFMNENVVRHIGRAMGMVLEVDYDAEAAARVEFACVCLNWDITQPLRFQRHFQFTAGVNTLLRFRYERLRGFCEACRMITHDTGACLIQNGGPDNLSDDEDKDDNDQDYQPQAEHHRNNGVEIHEMMEDEQYVEEERIEHQIQAHNGEPNRDILEGENIGDGPQDENMPPEMIQEHNEVEACHNGDSASTFRARSSAPMDITGIFNPSLQNDFVAGEASGSANQIEKEPLALQDYYQAYLGQNEEGNGSTRKRKLEEHEEVMASKVVVRDNEYNEEGKQSIDQIQGVVGPYPPKAP
ncbi:uncharacterized protein LOC112089906 [Eutrema salsugineum]|uniref:uncharacterized protein LOC112089906 n=1 Tax=Eutrema salsugineum TaxID=72664 RepID=UPI000CED38FB|nr:uncharacterized protein LOC112089906 [Eutrema salsugineum]